MAMVQGVNPVEIISNIWVLCKEIDEVGLSQITFITLFCSGPGFESSFFYPGYLQISWIAMV